MNSSIISIINYDEKNKKMNETEFNELKESIPLNNKKIIILCTQNSLSKTNQHFQHYFKEFITSTNMGFKQLMKIDASPQGFIGPTQSSNCRTRVYYKDVNLIPKNINQFITSYNKKNKYGSLTNSRHTSTGPKNLQLQLYTPRQSSVNNDKKLQNLNKELNNLLKMSKKSKSKFGGQNNLTIENFGLYRKSYKDDGYIIVYLDMKYNNQDLNICVINENNSNAAKNGFSNNKKRFLTTIYTIIDSKNNNIKNNNIEVIKLLSKEDQKIINNEFNRLTIPNESSLSNNNNKELQMTKITNNIPPPRYEFGKNLANNVKKYGTKGFFKNPTSFINLKIKEIKEILENKETPQTTNKVIDILAKIVYFREKFKLYNNTKLNDDLNNLANELKEHPYFYENKRTINTRLGNEVPVIRHDLNRRNEFIIYLYFLYEDKELSNRITINKGNPMHYYFEKNTNFAKIMKKYKNVKSNNPKIQQVSNQKTNIFKKIPVNEYSEFIKQIKNETSE